MSHSTPRQVGDQLVADQAKNQIQTFFDELKNGTRNYRTVASLDAQIAQEYQGRCVLELLQNAHDALATAPPGDPRRVSFVLRTDPDPVLLVGNSGLPFRREDFKGICQLAQSPKDPNESVGNKGLGFRSVLEVSRCPEIWSTTATGGDVCFSFRFDPVVVDKVAEAAQKLEQRGLCARSPFDPTRRLVDWTQEQLHQYRQRLAEVDAAQEAKKSLSPYLIPLLTEGMPAAVCRLLDEGHVTVIRLPLAGGNEAVQSVKEQLTALRDAESVIFLEHLARLVIEVDGERHVLNRVVESDVRLEEGSRTRQRRLRVSTTGMASLDTSRRKFHVWTQIVGGDDDPDGTGNIRDAVAHLPNRWPEVRQASVGIAVEDTPVPAEGVFVIFLPTEKATGTGAHVNAPFYGSLNRRQIDFDEPYNKLLLRSVEELCLDAVRDLAAAQPEGWRARAVVDILSSTTSVGGEPWRLVTKLCERAASLGSPLDDQAVVLCDDGWHTPGKARVMPSLDDDDLIGIDGWREQAGFAVVSKELDCRMDSVRQLINDLDGESDPTDLEWLDTIGRMAQHVQECSSVHDWNAFFRSLLAILPHDLRSDPMYGRSDPLAKARFLPSADGRLLAASDSTKLFFQPAQDDEDAVLVEQVPEVLRKRVAFLHPGVQTHEGQQGRNTEVQKFLDGRFALTFRREDILEKIVVPALPSLPVPHGGSEANQCAAILKWTLKLTGDEPPSGLLPLLRRLPVACHGGWFRVRDASFGPGWSNRHGDDIQVLASELPDEAAQRLMEAMLLPPDDERWQAVVEGRDQLFASIGVVEGLRLQSIEIGFFHMMDSYNDLIEKPPAGVAREVWTDWCDAIDMQPQYVGWHKYELSGILLLPAIHHFAELKIDGRNALSRLILASLDHWSDGWTSATVKKTSGNAWSTRIMSPLKHWLQTMSWLGEHGQHTAQLLSSRWFVPESLLRGQSMLYSHLYPLPRELARRLNVSASLLERLVELGLNVYPAESEMIGPELLDALAKAWTDNRVPAGRFDVFLGQVRHGWQHLDPEGELPNTFLVRTGRRREFSTRGRDELKEVYLPDDPDRVRTLQEHEKVILEMPVEEARRLADVLSKVTSVRKASLLDERHVIDGAAWDGGADDIAALDQTKYDWLAIVLLSVHAQGGNRTGADTESWRNAADRLRRTRVWECDEITVELVDEGYDIASSKPPAQWLAGDVLAVRKDLTSYDELASASQALLDRQDLLKDLRLVLGALSMQEPVTRERIESALSSAEIDAEALADIRQRWTRDMSLLADRIRPVLVLFGIPRDGLDGALADVDRLTEWLSANLPKWPTQGLLSAARKSPNDHAMGVAAWKAMGSVAQIPAWNAALSELGSPYETVENQDVSEQTKRHLEEATALLRGFARHVAIHVGDANLFHRIEKVTQAFSDDSEWATQWWEVPFAAIINGLRGRYAEIPCAVPYLDVLEDVETIDDLHHKLRTQGVEITPDPYETAQQNERRLESVRKDVHDLHQVWMELRTPERTRSRQMDVQGALPATAYLRFWSDAELLKMALEILNDQEFTGACDGCATLDAIRSRLNLTPKDVEARREARRTREREAERVRRTFDVAGEPFEVGGGQTYSELFDRLRQLPVPVGPCARQDEFTPLAKLRASPNRPGKRPEQPLPTPTHPSEDCRDLIGVVGEMHAYRFLRNEFSEVAVTLTAWVSEIRRKVVPPSEVEPHDVSDAHGFDFRFTHQRKTWHVEVKATIGDDLHFDLGVSEITVANKLARKRGGRWRILRVRRALSDCPEFDWLPNPFEVEFKEFYRLHQGGMRVSYSRKPAGTVG